MRAMPTRLIVTGANLEFSLPLSGKEIDVSGPDGMSENPDLPPGTPPQANFIDAILGRAEPLCPVQHGLTLAKFMDAVYASAELKTPVDITD